MQKDSLFLRVSLSFILALLIGTTALGQTWNAVVTTEQPKDEKIENIKDGQVVKPNDKVKLQADPQVKFTLAAGKHTFASGTTIETAQDLASVQVQDAGGKKVFVINGQQVEASQINVAGTLITAKGNGAINGVGLKVKAAGSFSFDSSTKELNPSGNTITKADPTSEMRVRARPGEPAFLQLDPNQKAAHRLEGTLIFRPGQEGTVFAYKLSDIASINGVSATTPDGKSSDEVRIFLDGKKHGENPQYLSINADGTQIFGKSTIKLDFGFSQDNEIFKNAYSGAFRFSMAAGEFAVRGRTEQGLAPLFEVHRLPQSSFEYANGNVMIKGETITRMIDAQNGVVFSTPLLAQLSGDLKYPTLAMELQVFDRYGNLEAYGSKDEPGKFIIRDNKFAWVASDATEGLSVLSAGQEHAPTLLSSRLVFDPDRKTATALESVFGPIEFQIQAKVSDRYMDALYRNMEFMKEVNPNAFQYLRKVVIINDALLQQQESPSAPKKEARVIGDTMFLSDSTDPRFAVLSHEDGHLRQNFLAAMAKQQAVQTSDWTNLWGRVAFLTQDHQFFKEWNAEMSGRDIYGKISVQKGDTYIWVDGADASQPQGECPNPYACSSKTEHQPELFSWRVYSDPTYAERLMTGPQGKQVRALYAIGDKYGFLPPGWYQARLDSISKKR